MGNSNKNKNQVTGERKDENAQAQNTETETSPANAENSQGNASENENVQPVNSTSDSQPETNQQPDASAPTDKDEQSLIDGDEEKAGDVQEKEMVKMVLKHKSHTPHYHRCGLTLTQVFAEYEVPEESVDKIKADKWIVVKDEK